MTLVLILSAAAVALAPWGRDSRREWNHIS